MSDLWIAVTIGSPTQGCASIAVPLLREHGRATVCFRGAGAAMEELILSGKIGAVLDLTLTELAAEMRGVWGGAGPDRLTAAARRGIPQVIVPGGLEAVDDQPTTPEECDRLGQEIAVKASAARGATTILVPRLSVSHVLVQSLRNWISPNVPVRELELHIDDPAFAVAAVEALEKDLPP